jgi:hypothetical protein
MAAILAQRWRRCVPWVLTAAAVFLLYHLTRDLQWSSLAGSAQQTALWVWLLSIGGFVISHGLRAGRIRAEWLGQLQMDWHLSWALTVRHAAWVVLAPLRAGEAMYVWTLHRQGGVAIKTATRSLIRLRLQDLAVLLLWTLLLAGPGPWAGRLLLCAALLGCLIFALPRWVQSTRAPRLLRQAWENAGLTNGSAVSWAYALLNWPVKFMALALPLQALTGLQAKSAWVAVTGGEWASLMPVQPIAGYGIYEAGVVAAARWMGPIAIAEVAAAALFVHSLSLAVTLGSAWLAGMLGWSQADLRIIRAQ